MKISQIYSHLNNYLLNLPVEHGIAVRTKQNFNRITNILSELVESILMKLVQSI